MESKISKVEKVYSLAESAYERFLTALCGEAAKINLSNADDIVAFFKATPERFKKFFNQEYASILLDNKVTTAPTPDQFFSSTQSEPGFAYALLTYHAEGSTRKMIDSLKEQAKSLDAAHQAETERLIDRCNNANSGTIVTDGSFGDFLAYQAYEGTINRNIQNTQNAIEEDFQETKQTYQNYVEDSGKRRINTFVFFSLRMVALGFLNGFLANLGPVFGYTPTDYFPARADVNQATLLAQAGRDEDTRVLEKKLVAQNLVCLNFVGVMPSLKEELELRKDFHIPSLIAGSYSLSYALGDFVSESRKKTLSVQANIAELIDFVFNNPDCSPAMANVLLYAAGPINYTGADYADLLTKLAQLGWDNPSLPQKYTDADTSRMLDDYFGSSRIARQKRLYLQGLYHYCEGEHYWRCLCGAINPISEDTCSLCEKSRSSVKALEANPHLITPEYQAKLMTSPKRKQSRQTIGIWFIGFPILDWILVFIGWAQTEGRFLVPIILGFLCLFAESVLPVSELFMPAKNTKRADISFAVVAALMIGIVIAIVVSSKTLDDGSPAIWAASGNTFFAVIAVLNLAAYIRLRKLAGPYNF